MSGTTDLRVLLVEDDGATRDFVADVLRREGILVDQAANGQEALELLVTEDRPKPSLILLDLEMPVMSGWEFLELVKSYSRLATIPVLVASYHQPRQALQSGTIVAAVPKPLEPEVLLGTVKRSVLESARVASTLEGLTSDSSSS